MLNIEKYRLTAKDLKPPRILEDNEFETTEDIKPQKEIVGQERSVKSLEFGLSMKQKGYNIYVSGVSGTGQSSNT